MEEDTVKDSSEGVKQQHSRHSFELTEVERFC